MKRLLVMMLCLIPFVGMQAKEDKDSIYMVVDELPVYKGGNEALYQWLGQNIVYPQKLRETGAQGLAMVSFVVNRNGTRSDIKISKSSGNEELDSCSLDIVRRIPKKFKPAKVNGKPVRMLMTLPVKWRLK